MKEFTRQHLEAAKKMPWKNPPRGMGELQARKFTQRTKRERRIIARYYRMRRQEQPVGTRNQHRMQGVVSAVEARIRIKHLTI